MGHRRLSIIDLAQGQQPMTDSSGNWIVFNGEIYNFLELRTELIGLGQALYTHSDTEVILAAYREWGAESLKRFNGMFAFALWDEAAQRLFIARDRVGKKPFYYALDPDFMVYGSEIKSLMTVPELAKGAEVDLESLYDYLSVGYILEPKSILKNLKKLPAAHFGFYDPKTGTLDIKPYWDLKDQYQKAHWHKTTAQLQEELLALFEDSVKIRLRADVPLGGFLSGGLDSSSVFIMMDRLGIRQKTAFCIGFEQSSFDESLFAAQVAQKVGAQITYGLYQEPGRAQMAKLVWQMDEPFADNSSLPSLQLTGLARKGVTVALSGDGADELLAGYPTYQADRYYQAYAQVPGALQGLFKKAAGLLKPSYQKLSFDYKLKKFLGAGGLSAPMAHYHWRSLFEPQDLSQLLRPEVQAQIWDYRTQDRFQDYYNQVGHWDQLDQHLYVDMRTWLVDDILFKVDRMSMANSLEVRSPFMDYRFIEFCFNLPPHQKQQGKNQKRLLRSSMAPYLPESAVTRPKKGFSTPKLEQGSLKPVESEFFQSHFALDPAQEDVTYKAYNLTILNIWLTMFERFKKTGKWEPVEIPN
ncbi:MAG: asparagine synthase (glutamine-hydrolyzing) [Candidatus Lambdaproteobacteria bacterium RIFOXYD2_FULL_50_16]|uniref:asparagine synthase (glutamine-hydrolyzing) n=1 Tax=Candidatus Lambdaproteobacteria bacterium RIFOXYD2_FULL_50_16 TaxID=1817772 RepID=A0A1F6G5S8_9PROT|nr:MAG: asparagine synthase (glutamine-hydrolyzing) [Candidatus Lambdaproteobacteria bacterium RIFOXYD2_FULL_50_16]